MRKSCLVLCVFLFAVIFYIVVTSCIVITASSDADVLDVLLTLILCAFPLVGSFACGYLAEMADD